MTTIQPNNHNVFPTPVHGADIASGANLPAPVAPAEHIEVAEHAVEIFSSREPFFGPETTHASQVLHTEVYLERGLIGPADLNEDGLFLDEYSNRSTHLFSRNGVKVAAVRTINADKKDGILSLPTAKHFEINGEQLCETAGVKHLSDIKPKEIVEISGLVARKLEGRQDSFDATLSIYARLLRDSVEQGHKVWLSNVEPTFKRYLNIALGSDQAQVLGDKKEYMGPATVPIAINPLNTVRSILEGTGTGSDMRRAYIKQIFNGIDVSKVPKDMRKLFEEHGIETAKPSIISVLKRNPRAIGYAVIMGYSSIRALPTVGVEEFEGSTALLWGIDVATAVPYTWGAMKALDSKTSRREKVVGGTVAAACFSAPYVYFAAEGNNYPPAVNAVIGGFIGAAVVKEFLSTKLRNRKNAFLNEGLVKAHQTVQPDITPPPLQQKPFPLAG